MKGVLLDSPELDAYGQMALDELLLLEAPPETMILRFYRWSGPAATFGYFQEYDAAVRALHERGRWVTFPLARRPTGGGLVIHDGDLTFSLVFPWRRLVSPSWLYRCVHRGIHVGLKASGLGTRLWSAPPGGRPAKECFAGPVPMDLVLEDGRKCLGGALRRRKGTGLYQGSLRTEGLGISRGRLAQALAGGISLEWRVVFVPEAAGPELLRKASRLRLEKHSRPEWNKRR